MKNVEIRNLDALSAFMGSAFTRDEVERFSDWLLTNDFVNIKEMDRYTWESMVKIFFWRTIHLRPRTW